MIISFFIDRLQYTTRFTLRNSFEVVLIHGSIIISLQKEYTVSKAAISKWVKPFRDECQDNPKAQSDYDYMKENLRLRKELEEAQKEVLFLKKAAAFFAKEID